MMKRVTDTHLPRFSLSAPTRAMWREIRAGLSHGRSQEPRREFLGDNDPPPWALLLLSSPRRSCPIGAAFACTSKSTNIIHIMSKATTTTPMDISTDKENRKQPSTSKSKGGYQMPWIERYRPRTLDDVVGNEETVSRLRAIAETGNLPNLILSGPRGSGKTTSVHALARQLLGAQHVKDAVLELNASDARGIDVSKNTKNDCEMCIFSME